MGKWKLWLLITMAVLVSLVDGIVIGRAVRTAETTTVDSATRSSAIPDSAINDGCKFDPSGHKVQFVTVEPGVQLEVLDWGGAGDTLVLLAGLGDNAHVFDD